MNKYLIYPLIIFIVVATYFIYAYYLRLKKSGIIRDMGSNRICFFLFIVINLIIFLFNYFNYKYKWQLKDPFKMGNIGRRGDPEKILIVIFVLLKLQYLNLNLKLNERKFLIDENNVQRPRQRKSELEIEKIE